MQSLPFEILRDTFNFLEVNELLECQLTCRNWYNASLELLYSNIQISSNIEGSKYISTISNHPRLGSYLKKINTKGVFKRDANTNIWDECNLLNALAEYCPNMLKLDSDEQDLNFWTRISDLAQQGSFSQLQYLPRSNSDNLESYITTTLSFKLSLTCLFILDDHRFLELDLNNLMAYQMLRDQIYQFKNLQSISFSYQSNKQLSYFDTLIENCPHLKNIRLAMRVFPEDRMIIEPEKIINPRPNIQELECKWEMVGSEIQLQYLIQKFPNLQTLKIGDGFS